MNKIKTILFPTDFSETARNAFVHCLMIARELKANVTLLHAIYPEYEALDLPVMAAKATKDRIEAARLTLQSFLEFTIAELQKHHRVKNIPEIKTEVDIGGAISVITTIARRDEVDLIIMGTQGEHSAVERAFGSVTTGVFERAHCPVLVIPEKAAYQRIQIAAYATDLNEAEPYHLWLAGRLLEAFSPILHVVHIRTTPPRNHEIDYSELKELFGEKFPALQVRFHQIPDLSVVEGLEEFVDNFEVDLLMMYAPEHNLLERIFQRSRTRRMAMKAHVPLLLIK